MWKEPAKWTWQIYIVPVFYTIIKIMQLGSAQSNAYSKYKGKYIDLANLNRFLFSVIRISTKQCI